MTAQSKITDTQSNNLESESKSPVSIWHIVAALAIGGGTWALSRYSGPGVWIPGTAAIVLLIALTQSPIRPQRLMGFFVLAGAHLIWFLVLGVESGAWRTLADEIALSVIMIVWLTVREGPVPVMSVAVILIYSSIQVAKVLWPLEIGTPEHRVLTAHLVLHAATFLALAAGYGRSVRLASHSSDPELAE